MFPDQDKTDKCKSLRRSRCRSGWLALVLALLFAFGAIPLYSQQAPSQPKAPPIIEQPPIFPNSKAPDYSPAHEKTPTFEDLQYRRYIESRLKSMVSDADKLLKLAKELNKETDTTAASAASREDMHTVGEIEKLAHNVKWKMQLVVDAPNH